jgi:pimeloyl-ACP methyl ester carboxylesterase
MMKTVSVSTGATLAYDDYDFTAPWDSAPPVVLVHGFSKNRRFWHAWIPALAARYRVIAPDQRAHGDSSPAPAGFRMALEPFSDDLAAFLDALGLETAHFVMAEFSSAVAVDFAGRYASRIRSLTLPGFGYDYTNVNFDALEWARIAAEEGSAAWARATSAFRLPPGTDPALREWYIKEQSRMDPAVISGLFRFTPTLDLTDRLSDMNVPTLIIAGGGAKQGPIEQVERAVDLIPDCRLTVLDGLPFNVMTVAPERCVAETLAFIGEIEARR